MNRTFKAALLASIVLASTAISIAAQVREPSGTTQESIKDTTSDSTVQVEMSASGAVVIKNEATEFTFPLSRFNAKKGQVWLGGRFSFTTLIYDKLNHRENLLSISPTTRFFPANNFCLGPKFGWMGGYEKNYSRNAISIGGDIGFVGSGNSVLPYVLVSPYAFINSMNYHYSSYHGKTSITFFVLPIFGGLLIPVGKSGIGLQVEIGNSVSFEGNDIRNMFGLVFGVCGLGQKIAIGFLNVIGTTYGMN